MAGNREGTSGGSGASGNSFGANIFLQNLLQLAKLTSLDFAAHLLFNFALTGTDNKLVFGLVTPGPTGAVPTGTSENPFIVSSPSPFITPHIKNAVVYTLSVPLTNQPSPVIILTAVYTPMSATSTLLILGAAKTSNTTPGSATWDLGLYIGSTLYTSSRIYQNTDSGSTTLYTYYANVSVVPVTINLKAVLHSGATHLEVANAYITVVEF